MSSFKKLVQKSKANPKTVEKGFNLENKTIADKNRVVACPCQSNKKYVDCCEPIHQNIFKAFTAEQLMRSRYSAYALSNIDYLIQSQHKSTLSKNEHKAIKKWNDSVKWLKLEVIKHEPIDNELAYVIFKAHYIQGLEPGLIYEKSRFTKQDKHWVYIDGEFLD